MNTARKVFLALFIISTLVVLTLVANLSLIANFPAHPNTQVPAVTENPDTVVPTVSPDDPETDPSAQNTKMGTAALIGSLITSVTSLVGFVTTTVITWRKEKRDASLADVQRKKLETELEKSKLELERLKKSKPKRKTKR